MSCYDSWEQRDKNLSPKDLELKMEPWENWSLEMPPGPQKLMFSEKESLEHMLCKTCCLLSKDQMSNIGGICGYPDLLEWYRKHLISDAVYYYKYFKSNEIEKKEESNKQLQRIINECIRLEWKFEMDSKSINIE